MNEWLAPVCEALDSGDPPRRWSVFFRDDDVGWDDSALLKLLDVFAHHHIPIDLAVIPRAILPPLAAELLRRRRRTPIGLHQHGLAHINHEPAGRKCEFGSSRTPAQLAADVAAGQRLLGDVLGDAVDPIFTPPWNRCCNELATTLVAAGIEVLSRDATATPLGFPEPLEVPITVDWFGRTKQGKRGRKVPWTWAERGQAIAAALGSQERVGIMLHHAACDDRDRAGIDELLELLASHRRVKCAGMMDVVGR